MLYIVLMVYVLTCIVLLGLESKKHDKDKVLALNKSASFEVLLHH